ncbi:hypothetical protein BaRGS_00023730 [Batillaria attramentaria]|uniref:Uncharacterized protein n=1 Tax=Batillaria attramentaria TaxID=370345 RepID=A0ABD0KD63_9CAEN
MISPQCLSRQGAQGKEKVVKALPIITKEEAEEDSGIHNSACVELIYSYYNLFRVRFAAYVSDTSRLVLGKTIRSTKLCHLLMACAQRQEGIFLLRSQA